jgi:hypothetical protein
MNVLVAADQLLAERGRVVLLDVRWALGDPHGREHYLEAVRCRRPAPDAVVTATAVSGSAVGDP